MRGALCGEDSPPPLPLCPMVDVGLGAQGERVGEKLLPLRRCVYRVGEEGEKKGG